MSDAAFVVLAVLLLGFAAATVLARNLFRAVFALAGALLSTAFFYVLLSAPLLAAVQILLYTGGVLTLVVFALVMTHRPEPERPWRRPIPAAILAAATFAAMASFALRVEGEGGRGLAAGAAVGREVFTTYVVPFELLSVLLLAALFGALVIARRDDAP